MKKSFRGKCLRVSGVRCDAWSGHSSSSVLQHLIWIEIGSNQTVWSSSFLLRTTRIDSGCSTTHSSIFQFILVWPAFDLSLLIILWYLTRTGILIKSCHDWWNWINGLFWETRAPRHTTPFSIVELIDDFQFDEKWMQPRTVLVPFINMCGSTACSGFVQHDIPVIEN